MKASYLAKPGGSLKYGELPTPPVASETAKINVLYCGVNHLDVLIRQGKRPGIPKFPHVLGSEVVGMIEEIQSKTKKFEIGDTVAVYPWTFCGICKQCKSSNEQICDTGGTFGRTSWGGYAQYLITPIHNLIKLPQTLPLDGACALILAGTTAQHLVERAGVRKNQTVLVTGATGGVGTIVMQLVRNIGATIIAATAHLEKSQRLKQLGAKYVVSVDSMVKDIDVIAPRGVSVVIDIVGGTIWSTALTTLAKGGRMVFCSTSREEAGQVPIGMAFSRQWNILGSYGGNRKHLKAILAKCRKGVVTPVIDATFPLSDAPRAHEKIDSQNIFGKILLRP